MVFIGTEEGGQAGDGRMTRVKRGGQDWRNICRQTQETMTAAHKKLSPNGNLRMDYICVLDRLCFHFHDFLLNLGYIIWSIYSRFENKSFTSPERDYHFITLV